MKQLCAYKWLTVVIVVFFMGTVAYGDTTPLPDPLKLVSESKYYEQITKAQATEIIEKCASKTYSALSIVKEDKFFMSVPKQTYAHPSGIRTTTKFNWAEVKSIELLQKAVKFNYWTKFFGTNVERSLEIAPDGYELADLALAAMTLTGLPFTREQAVTASTDAAANEDAPSTGEQKSSSAKRMSTDADLEKSLIKLRDLYDKGLISDTIYESKQKELLDGMLGN